MSTTPAPTITVETATNPFHWNAAESMLWEYIDWICDHAGVWLPDAQPSVRDELVDLAAAYAPPCGRLYVGRVDGRPAGMVGIRDHADGSSEMKRLFVRADARGSGLATELVERLVDDARRAGRSRIWLETAVGVMDVAIALYDRFGFTRTATVDASVDHPSLATMELDLCASIR